MVGNMGGKVMMFCAFTLLLTACSSAPGEPVQTGPALDEAPATIIEEPTNASPPNEVAAIETPVFTNSQGWKQRAIVRFTRPNTEPSTCETSSVGPPPDKYQLQAHVTLINKTDRRGYVMPIGVTLKDWDIPEHPVDVWVSPGGGCAQGLGPIEVEAGGSVERVIQFDYVSKEILTQGTITITTGDTPEETFSAAKVIPKVVD